MFIETAIAILASNSSPQSNGVKVRDFLDARSALAVETVRGLASTATAEQIIVAVKDCERRSKRRILFADDNLALQRIVRRVFEHEGYEVIVATTGEEAVARAIDSKPDVIVLDVAFPDEDGRDVLARLKRDQRTSAIMVLVWSGGREDRESDRRISLDLGAEDYIEKADAYLLLRKIDRVLLHVK